MNATRRLRSRAGMTLVEVMVALVIGLTVIQVGMSVLSRQSKAFSRGTASMGLLQNSRYAVTTLEKDLRTLGTGALATQPPLVYAGTESVAFNSNFVSLDPLDVSAVYVDSGVPAAQREAATPAQRFVIPRSSFAYPDTSYMDRDVNSSAETVTFFFEPDATTSRTDDWALWRQVNNGTPAVISRNILKTGSTAFLEYQRIVLDEDNGTQLVAIAGPLSHTAKIHGSPLDVGVAARIDSVRAVRVRFTVTNGKVGKGEQLRTVDRTIRLPNAGMAVRRICGDRPRLGVALGVARVLVDGKPAVTLSWYPAVDENGGEGDVLRYIVWRRESSKATWGDPYLSFPTGLSSYTYTDQAVVVNETYQYALAAQDCTPSTSALVTSVLVKANP